jgi:hypothetical protein
MSRNSVPLMQSHHGQPGEEKQKDTTDPAIVEEYFFTLLRAVGGEPTQSDGVWKNTREEVLKMEGTKIPWRRSPCWLFLRAALQLSLTKGSSPKLGGSLYKRFMVYFMSYVLDNMVKHQLPAAMIFATRKKVELRLSKLERHLELEPQAPKAWLPDIRGRIDKATEMLQGIQTHGEQMLGILPSPKFQPSDIETHSNFQLLQLDHFLRDTHAPPSATPHDPQPRGRILHYAAETLPDMKKIETGQYTVFDLAAFEEWVAFHLDNWLSANLTQKGTCHKLSKLMVGYHRIAKSFYAECPEALSSMLLTVSELWVACDKSAVATDDLLLQYDHEVPIKAWSALLLPFCRQMERLSRVESYLSQRSARKNLKESVLSSFGHADSYSVRYFQRSTRHTELRKKIESMAEAKKQAKWAELSSRQKEYRGKTAKARKKGCDCDMSPQMGSGQKVKSHMEDCQWYSLMREAEEMTIRVYEWPLPTDEEKAMSTVFELDVPEAFAAWRDATLFLCRDVLRLEPYRKESATTRTALLGYPGLEDFHKPQEKPRRIRLISESSPNSKRIGKGDILNIKKQEVIVNCSLHWRFIDKQTNELLGKHNFISGVRKDCSYTLNKASESLNQFLHEIHESDRAPNAVIAQQSVCPEHMSLSEFEALCSLPSAPNTYWLNLLRELAMPSVD